MFKPLGWAAFATIVNVLLGVAFVAFMRIRINQAVVDGMDLSLAFRVAFQISVFLQHFWWFFVPVIFIGWTVVCYIVYGIRRSSAPSTLTAYTPPQ
jgi:hypothetical protein